jgi:hypothetical protein
MKHIIDTKTQETILVLASDEKLKIVDAIVNLKFCITLGPQDKILSDLLGILDPEFIMHHPLTLPVEQGRNTPLYCLYTRRDWDMSQKKEELFKKKLTYWDLIEAERQKITRGCMEKFLLDKDGAYAMACKLYNDRMTAVVESEHGLGLKDINWDIPDPEKIKE